MVKFGAGQFSVLRFGKLLPPYGIHVSTCLIHPQVLSLGLLQTALGSSVSGKEQQHLVNTLTITTTKAASAVPTPIAFCVSPSAGQLPV